MLGTSRRFKAPIKRRAKSLAAAKLGELLTGRRLLKGPKATSKKRQVERGKGSRGVVGNPRLAVG
jgi:hypothetical protein